MSEFQSSFFAFLGGGLGIAIAALVYCLGLVLVRRFDDLLRATENALERYANASEKVVEYYRDDTQERVRCFSKPKPHRVELAKQGKAA